MKTLAARFFLLSIIGLVFGSCAKISDDDPCEDSKMPLVQATFKLNANVMRADSTPYVGQIRMNIKKTYCSGETAGNYFVDHATTSNGTFYSGMVYSYKYENLRDEVTVTFLTPPSTSPDWNIIFQRTYPYAYISHANNVTLTYDIVINQ